MPIEISRKSFLLSVAAVAVALVALSWAVFELFLVDLRSRERELLLDEIRNVRTQAMRTAGRIEQFLASAGDRIQCRANTPHGIQFSVRLSEAGRSTSPGSART